MRYHARAPWDGVTFPTAPHTVCNGCRAGNVGHLFGSFGTDVRLRRPVVVVIWWDDHAPLEWNRQATEHAGLTSNCRHRVIRQRRTERQKHPCPLPQPIERSGAVANLFTPTGHIVRQSEENMWELPILIFWVRARQRATRRRSSTTAADHRRPHSTTPCAHARREASCDGSPNPHPLARNMLGLSASSRDGRTRLCRRATGVGLARFVR